MGTQFSIKGRLVQGDPYKMTQRTDNTNQPRFKPDGSPMMSAFVALAVPKNDPAWPAFRALCDGEAQRMWPRGEHASRTFANKIEDGDSVEPNKKGKRNCDREGFAGHWIVKFSNGFAPAVIYWAAATGWTDTVKGGPTVKIGDYATIIGDIESNQSTQSPGMYMNVKTIAFEAEGPAIAQEVDYSAVLGTRGNGAASAPPPVVPVATTSPISAPPPPPIVPHTAFMQAPPPPPPVAVGPVMLAAAKGATYQSMINAGWTNELLVQHGMMAA